MNRDKSLLMIRPTIQTEMTASISKEESFQNNTLRPILKFQNDHLIRLFLNSNAVIKSKFVNGSDFDKNSIIVSVLKSDQLLKNSLVQAVVSMMTEEESVLYYSNKSEFKKRILSMTKERLISQLLMQKALQ